MVDNIAGKGGNAFPLFPQCLQKTRSCYHSGQRCKKESFTKGQNYRIVQLEAFADERSIVVKAMKCLFH